MDDAAIRTALHTFLGDYFEDYQLEDDEDIFATGFVNSMFAMQLVMFIEKEFTLTIDGDDLVLNNFRTIANMHSLTAKTRALFAEGE